MKRIGLAMCLMAAALGCRSNKANPGTGSGSGSGSAPVVVAGSGSGSGSGSDTGSGSGSGSGGLGSNYKITGLDGGKVPPIKLGANEAAIGNTKQLEVVEHKDKSTATERAFSARSVGEEFVFDFTAAGDKKDEPAIGEFPVDAPKYKNMNTTEVVFHLGNGAFRFQILNFDEIAKGADLKPADVSTGFDGAVKRGVETPGFKVVSSKDDNIDGQQGRIVTFAGTRDTTTPPTKVEGKLIMVFVPKLNSFLLLTVQAPPGDPALVKADEMMKSLTLKR